MKHYLGVSAGFHDAAISLINSSGDILFAGHSERYSLIKNDPNISNDLLKEIYGFPIDSISYYERPWSKQLRRLYSGEGVQWSRLGTRRILEQQLQSSNLPGGHTPVKSYNHHLSHAAAGFQTSVFDRATVVIIDAIGEWDTISIWGAEYVNGAARYKRLWGQKYPHSIGLFYSAATQAVGLKPNEDEYILMGMAAYGQANLSNILKHYCIQNENEVTFQDNYHVGIGSDISTKLDLKNWANEDIAAGVQALTEGLIYNIMLRARDFKWSTNLVYMGGVALNCLANRKLGEYFDKIWIMPCPGDAGSSLGCAALDFGGRLDWSHPYLGRDIPGPYPTNKLLDHLVSGNIVGVASGRAEFGPRALGNRSLLADPRGHDTKDKVNEIKQRQKFRPFAPVILAEMADQYFAFGPGWTSSPYMQSVATCLDPDNFPAIVHHDGTSRVQTVAKGQGGIREILEKWYVWTGCPMLLNTSLNVRGEPMVNDRADADRFQELYGVPVLS